MDSYPYFTPAPHAYQFIGLPPTPAHTGSTSDDYSNSPPVRHIFHPSQSYSQSILTPRQDAFEFQNNFDFNQFNNGAMPQKPPTPVSQHKPSIGSAGQMYDVNGETNDGDNRRGSNSDDDENMPPAQARRKAQNRAA